MKIRLLIDCRLIFLYNYIEMSRKFYLTEEKLRTIVQEELGVALKVKEIGTEIYNRIKLEQNNGDVKVDDNSNLHFIYQDNYKNGYSKNDNTVYISKGFNNNDRELKNTIFHEVEHYWQTKNANKNFGEDNVYQVCVNGFDDDYYYYSCFCKAYYYCKKFEIDARCNGVYGEYRWKPKYKGNFEDFLKENELGQYLIILSRIKKLANTLDYNDDKVKFSIDRFIKNTGLKIDNFRKWFQNTSNNAYEYLYRQAVRIFTNITTLNEDLDIENLNTLDRKVIETNNINKKY